MLVTTGLIMMFLSGVSYFAGLKFAQHFYRRTFRDPPSESFSQFASNYSSHVTWAVKEGTMPKWVPQLVSISVLSFLVGAAYAVVAIFV